MSAHAQQRPSDDEADRTFQEGRALLANDAVQQACDAFAKSYELRPRSGTLLNLAVCLERQGDLVAAFGRFEESLTAAIEAGRGDREELARAHIEVLKTKLAWLTIELEPDANLAGLEIFCDESAIPDGQSSPVPLEPGVHVVKARAPGHAPFELSITTTAGNLTTIRIPALSSDLPVPARSPAVPLLPKPSIVRPPAPDLVSVPQKRGPEPISVSLLALGVASLSVGTIYGVRALVDGDAVEQLCIDRRCTSDNSLSEARRLEARARVEARIADIALPLGAISLGVSTYMIWTQRRQPQPNTSSTGKLRVVPAASLNAVSASVGGTW